jgi:hypothetical protein
MSNMRNAAIAALASALLSLPAISAVQAYGGQKTSVQKNLYDTTGDTSPVNRETPKPDAAFHSSPTWPEGEPDYHGSNGG